MNETEIDKDATIIARKVGEQMVVLMDPTEGPDDVLRTNRSREKTFIFDTVFDMEATQEEVYKSTIKDLIEGVISGYNATVFAYGSTGTGKTYTMLGMDCDPGIYIRTLNDLFKAIEGTSDSMDYTVSMSYLEIYNDIIRDLLNPSSGVLELREDAKGVIQIAGITEFSTSNANEIMQLLRKGNKQRTQEPTAANKTSSRSHAVLQVTVRQKSRAKNTNEEVRIGKLFMIDLAGSERASQVTQNHEKRMKEGAHINRSLLALGNCITALSEKGSGRNHHVNFRDSKLTRLLKDALGGNSRTVMIAHISPASTSFEESRTTLIYAYRAKNIKTRVKRNLQNVSYHIAQYNSIIAELHKEIERLKETVKQHEKEQKPNGADSENVQEESEQICCSFQSNEMNNLRHQLVSAFEDQMEMRRSLMQLENSNIELHIDTSRHLVTIADWEQDKARRASKLQEKFRNKVADDMDTEEEEEEADSPEPHEVMVAREEINMLLAEQRKTAALKADLEKRLAETKLKASQLEQLLPKQITSGDQQEVLKLLCRVHELEVGNTELQAKSLCKENLLYQKDFVILRYQQHRALCEEIIQCQRALIEDNKLHVPDSVEKLYRVYSKELEEGTLNRLQQLHSVLSSTLGNGPTENKKDLHGLGKSCVHLDIEQLQKVVSDGRKHVHSRAKVDLPPIVCESGSDSKTPKSTPNLIQTRENSSLTPTIFHPARTPIRQNPNTQNLILRNHLHTERRGSLSFPPLVAEPDEIAIGTKSISLVAARRRSRVLGQESSFFQEHTSSLKPLHALEPKDVQSKCFHSPLRKKNERQSLELPTRNDFKKDLFPLKSKKGLMSEKIIERKYHNQRSRSFEAIRAELPKVKPQSLHKHNNITHPIATSIGFRLKTFVRPSNISHIPSTIPVVVLKEIDQSKGGLQIPKASQSPPSTVHLNNVVHSKVKPYAGDLKVPGRL
ncbi:kinesin-like protein KIF19 [Spea bombifrons]|uniref:kinesin-like protein KIF19 n=1 Tax=Spea bombifrons TaxID=233779 RepID=UPI0023498595|nr:kinesin-like protein KIF19 [Spea bombifrons]